MDRVKITITHPVDLWGEKVGGIRTFIKTFVKRAPEDFSIAFIGVTGNPSIKVGEWQSLSFEGRKLNFLPILYVENENMRDRVPLSLKFTLALSRYIPGLLAEKSIWNFHRIETALPFKSHLPGVLCIHGHMMDVYNPHSEVKWSKFPALYFWLEERLMGKFDRVYVVRSDGAQFYKRKYPCFEKRFKFLPTWVDDEIFYPVDPLTRQHLKEKLAKEEGFSPWEKLVIFVGRLEGQKDPFLMLEVFKRLVSHDERSRLIIMGTGSLEKEVREKIKALGIQDKVTLTGVLPQSRLADFLRAGDVFLMTSAFEGMPISVLESLACGLPVVSTDVGEVGRVVKDGVSGRLCSSRDPQEICRALKEVLESKRIRTKGCVESVKPYTAKLRLGNIYKFHRELSHKYFG